jgi:hypothetical protein
MPCKKRSVNYKNKLLMNIVADVLPNGKYGWQTVALAYQEQSKEEVLRNSTDMKKHWIKVLCNGMKKRRAGWGRLANRYTSAWQLKKNIKKPFGNDGLLFVQRRSHFRGVGHSGQKCPAG